VIIAVCAEIDSRDLPRRVDGLGRGACGAREIECGEGPVAGPQEAATNVGSVIILNSVRSRDRPRRVDGDGVGA
jgi:hypothetical protein